VPNAIVVTISLEGILFADVGISYSLGGISYVIYKIYRYIIMCVCTIPE
jgi:hypothetical protein